jgi:tol-pal system protein YbgF
MNLFRPVFCAFVALAIVQGRAWADDVSPSQRPLVQLAQWGGGNSGGDQQAAEMSLRMNRLEEQMRQMNGHNEELGFKVQRLEDQLKRIQEDIDFRFQELEGSKGGGKAAPGRAPAAPGGRTDAMPAGGHTSTTASVGAGAENPALPAPGPANLGELAAQSNGAIIGDGNRGGPMDLSRGGTASGTQVAAIPGANASDEYALAVGFLQRREYDYAEAQFSQFLQQYPQDAKAPDALYGLGESFYYRKRYNDALESYLKVVQGHGQSAKAPDSLVRLGMTLAAINEKQQGCAALAEVGRKYPNATSAKSQASRESKRIGC